MRDKADTQWMIETLHDMRSFAKENDLGICEDALATALSIVLIDARSESSIESTLEALNSFDIQNMTDIARH